MSEAEATILAALIGLTAAILLQILKGFLEHFEAKRKEHREDLKTASATLAELRGEIQWAQLCLEPDGNQLKVRFLSPDSALEREAFQRLQIALGKASAIMLGTSIPKVRTLGIEIMQPLTSTEKNARIEQAIVLLNSLLDSPN